MQRDQLIKRLMATFLEELEEHVHTLNATLLALEKGPGEAERVEFVQSLFRKAHSLKGAARSVDVPLIEAACHRVEEIFAEVREGRPLDPGLFPLLFATADGIEEVGMRLREQADLADAPHAGLLPQLEAAAASSEGEPPPLFVPAPAAPTRRARPEIETAPRAADRSAPKAAPARPAGVEPSPEAAGAAATVRIPADKLDALLARSGELLVARRRVQARVDDLGALREFVGRWKLEWRIVEKALRETPGADGNHRGENAVGLMPRRGLRALRQAGGNLRLMEKDLDGLSAALAGDVRLLKETAGVLDDEVRRVRMFPFAEACQGLDRMVRDLAAAGGKEVEFAVEGSDIELDRSVLEGLKDPLRHLVRNAVDHGAESPEKRRAAGKRSHARITLAAMLRGAQVEVEVADDGSGLDLEAIRRQAHRRNLPEPADERELARLIFLPGFSTAPLVTDVSGRGVGLDVVKNRVEALHGTVELTAEPGRGTRFTLTVPLTLTTLRALLVTAGGQTFALAGTNVRQLVRVDPAAVRSIEGCPMLALGGAPLPLASLADTLGLPAGSANRVGDRILAVVVAAGEQRMAFVVDELLAEQEIVIKSLGARVRRARHFSGATILPSGRIALVLNAADLIRTGLTRASSRGAVLKPAAAATTRPHIVLAEDSVTTRTLVKSILEAAGYTVTAAADGAAAWQHLQDRGADIVVSDVDMPRMDGFALTEAVRGSKRFEELPVILVTARETERDKARGAEVGANAYLVKSAFDQKTLLATIGQLL